MEYRIHMPRGLLLFTKPFDVLGDGTTLLLLKSSWKVRSAENYYFLQFYNSSTKEFADFMEMARGFNGTLTFYTARSHPVLTNKLVCVNTYKAK